LTALARKTAPVRARRTATSVTLDQGLVAAATELGISVSAAAEFGLRQAIAARREEKWAEDNHEAIASANEYVAKHGLPLEKHRIF
jgi:antitoxin CcdA